MNANLSPLPTLFLAHGSPMLALTDIPAQRYLKELGTQLPPVESIVIMSPHWETKGLRVNGVGPLKTIHDFRGFPRELYEVQYPAEATCGLVGSVMAHLNGAGLSVTADNDWGLDHGAWVPLSLLFPKLEVPVVQVSVPYSSTPSEIFAIGKALAPLREKGVLLVGSGGTVHNLRELAPEGAPAPLWVKQFDAYLDKGLETGKIESFECIEKVTDFRRAHPTEEHLMPLFFAMGGAADETGRAPAPHLLHRSYSHGSISMSYWSFGESELARAA